MKSELSKRILSSIIIIPIVFFFTIKGSILFNIFIIICLIITIYEWNKISVKKIYNILGLIFLCISFYSTFKLRNDFDYTVLLFVVIVCISTDLGGYIFGKIFKGPKLTKISPNKTISGMFGGYLLSIIFTSIYLKNSYIIDSINFPINIIILIFLISTVSQFGDIIISYFKRLSKIKDTGKIIPGHGGLLDRIDGMVFAFPFSYLIFSINPFYYI